MLILTRKKDEQIIINDNIKVTVVECSGDHVKLGIEAPRDVKIYRQEVYLAIEAENRNAASGSGLPVIPSGVRKPATVKKVVIKKKSGR